MLYFCIKQMEEVASTYFNNNSIKSRCLLAILLIKYLRIYIPMLDFLLSETVDDGFEQCSDKLAVPLVIVGSLPTEQKNCV